GAGVTGTSKVSLSSSPWRPAIEGACLINSTLDRDRPVTLTRATCGSSKTTSTGAGRNGSPLRSQGWACCLTNAIGAYISASRCSSDVTWLVEALEQRGSESARQG